MTLILPEAGDCAGQTQWQDGRGPWYKPLNTEDMMDSTEVEEMLVESPIETNNLYTVTSLCVMIACNVPLGLVAFHFSQRAKDAEKKGDFILTRKFNRAAMLLNVTGLLLGCVVAVLFVYFYIYIMKQSSEI